MSGAYIKVVTEATPHAQIIFDRFHVQRLAVGHGVSSVDRRIEHVRRRYLHDRPTAHEPVIFIAVRC